MNGHIRNDKQKMLWFTHELKAARLVWLSSNLESFSSLAVSKLDHLIWRCGDNQRLEWKAGFSSGHIYNHPKSFCVFVMGLRMTLTTERDSLELLTLSYSQITVSQGNLSLWEAILVVKWNGFIMTWLHLLRCCLIQASSAWNWSKLLGVNRQSAACLNG